MSKPKMTKHQKDVSTLGVGDIIRWGDDASSNEVIKSIIINNPMDHRSCEDHRVTINDYHWYMDDVTIVKKHNICDDCIREVKNLKLSDACINGVWMSPYEQIIYAAKCLEKNCKYNEKGELK